MPAANGKRLDMARLGRTGRRVKEGMLLCLSLFSWSFGAQAASVAKPDAFEARCGALQNVQLPADARLMVAEIALPADGRPLRCVVRGRIDSSPRSTINWKVDLPDDGVWNKRLMMIGGGGFDGWLPTDDNGLHFTVPLLSADAPKFWGFVLASSDSGHQGKGKLAMADFSWAMNNPAAIKNHADMANHLTLQVASALTRQFYGVAPQFKYMMGLSNGGRAGLVSAQRHPEDYDGILSLAPAVSQEGFAANHIALQQHLYSDPANYVGTAEIELFIAAQVKACDRLDGLEDGVIDNYAACRFRASSLICKASGGGCLTEGQARTIDLVLSDRRVEVPMADGLVGYPAYGPGGNLLEWKTFLLGSSFAARDGIDYMFAENIVRYGIENDPNASIMRHNPEEWKAQYLALSEQIDATNPDLSAYRARKGKIIVWYGVGDYCVAMLRLAQYYRMVEAKVGKPETRQFFRMFVSPTIGHRMEGAGANSFSLMTALQDWVERDKAPDNQVAAKLDAAGKPTFTRPLCEVGSYPRYKGKGDVNKATSFACQQNPPS